MSNTEKSCNEMIEWILEEMPESKKQSLLNACKRNAILTSEFGLSHYTFTVYKEGWYFEGEGCRSRFAAWIFDRDGEFEFGRKPRADKLSYLYGFQWFNNTPEAVQRFLWQH